MIYDMARYHVLTCARKINSLRDCDAEFDRMREECGVGLMIWRQLMFAADLVSDPFKLTSKAYHFKSLRLWHRPRAFRQSRYIPSQSGWRSRS